MRTASGSLRPCMLTPVSPSPAGQSCPTSVARDSLVAKGGWLGDVPSQHSAESSLAETVRSVLGLQLGSAYAVQVCCAKLHAAAAPQGLLAACWQCTACACCLQHADAARLVHVRKCKHTHMRTHPHAHTQLPYAHHGLQGCTTPSSAPSWEVHSSVSEVGTWASRSPLYTSTRAPAQGATS